MDQDHLISQLSEILEKIQNCKEQTDEEFKKFQVALTGVLRLLVSEEKSPLKKMQGTPQDLKGYIIRLVSELHMKTSKSWENISSKLDVVLQDVRNA